MNASASSTSSNALSAKQREDLILQHDRVARGVARRYRGLEEWDDLLQIARLGLVKAAKRFDPARGVLFGTLAYQCAQGEILHHLRRAGTILVDVRTLRRHHLRPFTYEPFADDAPSYDTGFSRAEAAADLGAILSRLTRKQRTVLMLRRVCDVPENRIGRMMHMTQSAVNKATCRALARARQVVAS